MQRVLLIALLITLTCTFVDARPLGEITLAKFKDSFNQASNDVRIVALLSPS